MAAPRMVTPRSAARVVSDARTPNAAVAVLAPAGRDGAMARTILEQAGFTVQLCGDISSLCSAVKNEAGALLVAEEALAGSQRELLLSALEDQPSWSDVPVVVLTGEGELTRALSPLLEEVIAQANVTLIERPVRLATLVTALRSALRARHRQFDVRDHLEERGRAEADLRAAREEAEKASRAKGEFLAVMSHELRTPLNAIGGYAELMEMGLRGPLTEAQHLDLARIQQSQKHLLGLINQVLNYTKVETGTVKYDVAPVAVADALGQAETLIVPQARQKGIAYMFDECDPMLTACADAVKLQQILLNLLTNAIKFTPKGGRIRVSCSDSADTVCISITDTGCGIPPDRLAEIFEPFVQIDSRLTRTQEGVGLGLAISRDLARGMSGELEVDSTQSEGSTFTLTLPRAHRKSLASRPLVIHG